MAITKETLIGEVLRQKPEAAEILIGFGLGCISCPGAQMESLEEAAAVHGLNVDDLVEALNK